MQYTGNIFFNCFAGVPEQNRAPMTRAIAMIGGREYAIYLNELDGGVILAAHHVEGRDGNRPIVNRNPIAQVVADEIEGFEGVEYAFSLELDNGYSVHEFVVSEVRTNKNGTDYRLAQPLAIAKIRAQVVEKAAPTVEETPAPAPKRGRGAKTGTSDDIGF